MPSTHFFSYLGIAPPPIGNWILEFNIWNDAGTWIDTETWND